MFGRDRLKKKAMVLNNSEAWQAYRRQCNLVNNKIKKVRKDRYHSEINKSSGSAKDT